MANSKKKKQNLYEMNFEYITEELIDEAELLLDL